jgi:hypothetical protein
MIFEHSLELLAELEIEPQIAVSTDEESPLSIFITSFPLQMP